MGEDRAFPKSEAIALHGCTDQQLLNQLAALLRPAEVVAMPVR